MTSEFISGLLWGMAITIWIMLAARAVDYFRRRNLLKKYPGGILTFDETGMDNDDRIAIAAYHREHPDVAIIQNGYLWGDDE